MTLKTAPAFSTASSRSFSSSRLMHIGFSLNTWHPAAKLFISIAQCAGAFARLTTISGFVSTSAASKSVKTAQESPYRRFFSSADAGFRSTSAAISQSERCARTLSHSSEITPQPTTSSLYVFFSFSIFMYSFCSHVPRIVFRAANDSSAARIQFPPSERQRCASASYSTERIPS